MIDTHAHIYATEFAEDQDKMLERAFESGVKQIYMPNIDHTSIDGMLQLEEKYPAQCLPMMGLHPCYVHEGVERQLYLVEEWLSKRAAAGRQFIAVGEIGLDFYWDTTFRAQQEEAFRVQVQLAQQYNLPIVIHCRSSLNETVALLEQVAAQTPEQPLPKGIFHCFSGTVEDAQKVIELGFLLGIGGVSTFKNGGLDKILPSIDLKHIVLETDSPYLAPMPYRGKRNESSYLPLIAQRIADLKQTRLGIVVGQTSINASQLIKR